MSSWIAIFVGLLGAIFGSFSTVVIARVPSGRSIVSPGSACPVCGTSIAWYDNIPLISFVLLRRKCRNCGTKISARYPLIEAGNAGLWVVLTARLGLSWELAAYLAFATVLLILSVIDLEHHRLPNRILGPATIIGVALLAMASASTGRWNSLGLAGVGALAYGVPMFGLAIAVPRGMGMGDVKLAGYLGLHLGWLGLPLVLVGAMTGFFFGGLIGIGLLAAGKKGRQDPVPFGPSMAAGALLSVLAGSAILRVWLGI